MHIEYMGMILRWLRENKEKMIVNVGIGGSRTKDQEKEK